MSVTGPVVLHGLLENSARRFPDSEAVIASDVSITFAELDELTSHLSELLESLSIGRGARVGICAPKSIGTVAAIFSTLKSGGAYVPVDAGAPPRRNAYILQDCGVRVFFVDPKLLTGLAAEFDGALSVVDQLEAVKKYGADLVLVAVETKAYLSPATHLCD